MRLSGYGRKEWDAGIFATSDIVYHPHARKKIVSDLDNRTTAAVSMTAASES